MLELDRFEEKWGQKYPTALKSWRNNWHELSTFFKYPPAIRKMIYTTNRIENFNRSLRKTTKAKSAYPSDTALLKSLYLAIQDITDNWCTISGWHEIFGHLSIFFADRIQPGDFTCSCHFLLLDYCRRIHKISDTTNQESGFRRFLIINDTRITTFTVIC